MSTQKQKQSTVVDPDTAVNDVAKDKGQASPDTGVPAGGAEYDFGPEYKDLEGSQISLGNAVFWTLPSGTISLNRFVGVTVTTVPAGISQEEKMVIVNALKMGELRRATEGEKNAPPAKAEEVLLSDLHIQARKLLDERDAGIVQNSLSKIFSVPFINAALEVEKRERRREQYVTILTARLKELSR